MVIGQALDWETEIACDLETTGLDPFRDKILSIAIHSGDETTVFYGGVHDFAPIKEVLSNPKINKIWHNGLFDLKFIKVHLKIEPENNYDTMLAELIINGGKDLPVGLSDVIARRIGKFMIKETREQFIGHPGFDVVPPTDEQLKYIVEDVAYLQDLKRRQIQELIRTEQVEVAKLEMKALNAFVELETGGLMLDVDLWYEFAEIYQQESEKALNTMKGFFDDSFVLVIPSTQKGVEVYRPYVIEPNEEDLKGKIEAINFGSWKQLRTILNEYFGIPVDSTRSEVLEEYVNQERIAAVTEGREVDPSVDFVESILAYRKWLKRLSWDYPKFVHEVTGKVHPDYRTMGTDTGRVSCSEPNLQQVERPTPGEPNMRHLWKADSPEYGILRADYAQQEPRILGEFSQDKRLIAACNTADVYLEFAKLLYNDPTMTKKDEKRQIAKMFVLAVMYGVGDARLAIQSGLPIDTCRDIKQTIFTSFPDMAKYVSQQKTKMKVYGIVNTLLGRIRYIDQDSKKAFNEAVNTPIQGTAADMFKLALYYIWKDLTELKNSGKIDPNTRLWHIVHDEIEVHCRKDQVDIVHEIVKRRMEEAGQILCPSVKHFAETAFGDTWDK